ncbi:MAG: 50S ribosomal protein L11 methyltransferase [Lachnospiraceae bacterium]|nr:50S ribosomal protein L11 methyltransferase [Lachnospiraceae bacterium]
MKWNKYRLKTTTMAEDFVCGTLLELGISGVEVEDNVQITEEERKEVFADFLAELPEDDGTAYISFYTDEDSDDEEILDNLRNALKEASTFMDVGEGTIEKDVTEDKDWVNNWKQFFKSFTVGNFYIKPTWEEFDSKYSDYKLIEIDPGTAFGTGKHETTQLCITELCNYVKEGDKVCDLGCGSGILAMVAKKLGAGKTGMTDIDPAAITATVENFAENDISMDDVTLKQGNIIEDTKLQEEIGIETYDVVVANILADVIIPLSSMVDRLMKDGAVFISSGIIYMKEDDVVKAIKANKKLELIEVKKQGDWRAVVARKKA